MRRLSIGVQSFKKLREDDCVYVDKTEYIWKLVNNGYEYFLSRPRRFGKSLFLSTLKAYFNGEKDLFKGLAIEKLEQQRADPWVKYPVIHYSFASGDFTENDALKRKLNTILRTYEAEYELKTYNEDLPGDRFIRIINKAAKMYGKGAVILIDEYDKPLLDNIGTNSDLEEKNRKILKGFYTALKDADDNLKFAFITGVTKFSKISLFSDLNQLNDISLDKAYSEICGISEKEMEDNYSPEIEALRIEKNITYEECLLELRNRYDGYHFSADSCGLYNPLSILFSFNKLEFGNYWFSTGTPTFLINALSCANVKIQNFAEGITASDEDMTEFRDGNSNVIPLFYQSGYLTICGYDERTGEYTLSFPNNEVKYGFYSSLIPTVSPEYSFNLGNFNMSTMIRYIDNGDVDSFMTMIKALLASIPYTEGNAPKNEQEWRNLVYVIFSLLGQYVRAEMHTSKGRSDFALENEGYVYIFEFKKDKSAAEALSQINEMGYSDPYLSSGKKIVKIGANFSSKERTLSEWITE